MRMILALAFAVTSMPVFAQDPSCVSTELGLFCITVESGELVITQVSAEEPLEAGECSDMDGVVFCSL